MGIRLCEAGVQGKEFFGVLLMRGSPSISGHRPDGICYVVGLSPGCKFNINALLKSRYLKKNIGSDKIGIPYWILRI